MSFTDAKHLDIEKVPVIDISKLCDNTDPLPVAKALHKASTGLGFIYIKGHGIPKDIINSLRKEGLTFFRNNEKNKDEVKITEKHLKVLSTKLENPAKLPGFRPPLVHTET